MKKILSLLVLLLATVMTFAAERTVWEGTQQISWNTESFPGIQLDTYSEDGFTTVFSGLAKDDVVRLYTTTEYAEPQYALRYKTGDSWEWTDLDFANTAGVLSFTVDSGDMATWIAERGLVVTGQAYTLTKITIETPDSGGGETTETDLVVADGSSPLPLTLLGDWSAYTTFAATQFAKAKAGDVLTVYVSDVQEGAQISLKDMSDGWPALEDATAYPSVATDATTYTYTFTAETIAKVQANGLVIGGHDLTVNRVTLKSVGGGEEPVTYPIVIWEGEKEMPADWSGYQQIDKSRFASVKAGDLLSILFKNINASSYVQLADGTWAELVDTEMTQLAGNCKRFTITSDMLAKLQENGLIVKGINYTLTRVEIVDAASIKNLTCSVPVTGDDWVWTSAETPTFTVHITNNESEAVTAEAQLIVTTDKYESVTTLMDSKEIAAGGSDVVTFNVTETLAPSFYRATVTVNGEVVRAFNFGYAPTEIASPADKQADFDTFWQAAKDELAAIEATDEPVLTKIESRSTDKRTVYLVEFKSVSDGDGNPVTVRGYYAEPNDGKKHPVIMHYQGYDSGYRPGGQGVEPWCLSGDGDDLTANYAEFILSTRGQAVNNRPASERADGIDRDFTNTYGDWFAYNFGDKDKYYYRGAYMDCVRAIDFMASRPTSDMTNLYAEGQSQGGAFSYAAAALSGREFRAIAPGIAFMGDFPDYFELANWPASVARENQGTMTDAEMYAFLSYFDTKNLATLISNKTAVIATIGVQDNVCPPHTNIAPYNNLAEGTTKEISFNPENAHQVGDSWYSDYMNYFTSKYVEPQPEPVVNVFDEDGVADLSKFEVQDAGKVTYDADTHTVTTTEGWTGVQLTVADGEEVSGKELRITFADAAKVKLYVKYTDDTDADVIMDEAAEVLYFPLDETKKLYQLQVQPTEATSITFSEVKVNQESTKPVVQPLAEGETRVLFDDAEGTVLAWNEICQMNDEWGAILETGEYFLVTVKSRTEGSEWPKIILRDATSAEALAVELADVAEYPYIVKLLLTDAVVAQLKQGFRFSGDGITVTKIELVKPAPAKEGDITIEAMSWFRDATYDAAAYTATTTARWGQAGWTVGDDRYQDKTLVIVSIEAATFPVTLKMEYDNADGTALATSVGVDAGKTQINLPLPLDTKVIKKVYLTYSEPASVVLTDASVVSAANARPATGEADVTGIGRVATASQQTTTCYDLQGRRVSTPSRSLYIVNGKKVIAQ